MDRKKVIRISWYVLAGALTLFTIMFFLDIKFVVMGINILVLDALTAGIWIFARICKWAGHENTKRRTLAEIAITLAGLFVAAILLFGPAISGGWYEYAEGTEPQTHRTFVVEYRQNMLSRGTAKVYERFGLLLFPCDVPEYNGPLNFDESDAEYANVYISKEKQAIVVSLFTYGPIFYVPLELPEGTVVDNDHNAFLIDTGGELGTLLVTAELARTPTEDCNLTVRFSVWAPASMDKPLQTLTAGTDIFLDYSVIDANFDGYMDFTCTYLRENQSYYNHLWIWDENRKQFVDVPEYDEICAPSLDEETKTVCGYNRSNADGTGLHTFHQWVEGNLLCMRRIEIEGIDQSDIVRMSIRDRIAGELVEIYHVDFPSESGGWLDAQMMWLDLDYHGEPKEEK